MRMAKKNASKKLNDLDELLESLIPIPSPADIKNADKVFRIYIFVYLFIYLFVCLFVYSVFIHLLCFYLFIR